MRAVDEPWDRVRINEVAEPLSGARLREQRPMPVTAQSPPRVATFGESMALLSSSCLGSLALQPTLNLSTGGAEGNVAIGLARLGARVTWLGRIGDDSLGERVARDLRAENVETLAIVDDKAHTGLMLKERPAPDRITVTYYRAASAGSRLSAADVEQLRIHEFDLLHLTGITPALSPSCRDAMAVALRVANETRIPVSFDVNYRSRLWPADIASPVLRELAANATILFAGEDEAALITGVGAEAGPAAQLEAMAALGPEQVILKRGERGACALIDGSLYEQPPHPVAVVDTVGAGDAFVAGYLVEVLTGRSPSRRLLTATRAGAFACSNPGDWEGAPRVADLAAMTRAADPVRR